MSSKTTAPLPGFQTTFLAHHRRLKDFKYFELLTHAFVVILIISNLVGSKITKIGPFYISAAQALFPITYIFGDIFTEVYGYAASRRAIWLGFGASALLSVMGLLAISLPPAPGWENQAAFEAIFGFVPRMVMASLIAFWAGEFVNAFVMAKMKLFTQGRFLWMRTIGSTVAGQAVDTAVIIFIAFAGSVTGEVMLKMIGSAYLGKVLYEAAATPLTYLVVNGLKKAEGVDIYDDHSDFNPFRGEASRPQTL